MKKTLEFNIAIRAPRSTVWEVMINPKTYQDWTSAFCEGSYFKGSWNQGEKIQFLSPAGDGISAVIAENRLYEFISIRHVGEIHAGVEDLSSEKVRSWAPAFENYTFSSQPEDTEIHVTIDVMKEYEEQMLEAFPNALQKLKAICERVDNVQSDDA